MACYLPHLPSRPGSMPLRLLFVSSLVYLLSVSASAQRQRIDLSVAEVTTALAAQQRRGAESAGATLELPWLDGATRAFTLVEASQFEPNLRGAYPDIRSYRLVVPGSTEIVGRLNVSPEGVFAVVLEGGGAVEIQHAREGTRTVQYIERVDLDAERSRFTCGVEDGEGLAPSGKTRHAERVQVNSCFQLGATLRRYRMALTNTGEFAQLNGGTNASVTAAFNNRLAELNAIYEREAAVTFVLVGGNAVLVNLDPANDPFTNPNGNDNTTLSQGENFIESRLAAADYDIGHILHEVSLPQAGQSVSISGLAGVGVACQLNRKARGFSTLFNGASLTIFQHEVGHQFNLRHTNFGCGNSGFHRFEPGRGVTIMATPAGCDANPANVYDDIDRTRFHVGSLQLMDAFIAGPASCFAGVATGNAAPTSDANPTNTTYTIPTNTAFVLEGRGSDPDANTLTYSWEQIDTVGPTAPPTQTANLTGAPLFRSFAPVRSPDRYFPRLATLLSGTPPDGTSGETLPNVARTLNFGLTVRDNASGSACDQTAVTVVNTGAAFLVTSQDAPTDWTANGTNVATVTWDVAGTTGNGINTPTVDVLFSTDGGQTFGFAIASATPNDGSHTFTIPSFATNNGRIMVRGAGNIFLDINDADIAITVVGGCMATEVDIQPGAPVSAAAGSPELDLDLTPNFGTALNSPIAFSIDGTPSGRFVGKEASTGNCTSYNFGGTPTEVTSVTVGTSGNYTFSASGQGFTATMALFAQPYANGGCTGFVDATGRTSQATPQSSVTISNAPFTRALQSGDVLSMVVFSPFGNLGNATVTYSGGQLFTGTPPPPAATYSYTFAIVDDATGDIIAFDPSADLSDAADFPAGSYTVFGVSYEHSTSLAQFVGDSKANLQTAGANQTACVRTSSNEVSVTIQAPLPVELLSFTAVAKTAGNLVSWATASETNASHFDVERRDDGGGGNGGGGNGGGGNGGGGGDAWTIIGTSAATAPAGGAYALTDGAPPPGTSYYRLRSTDLDASHTFSQVVSVTRAAAAEQGFTLYPNPAGPQEVFLRAVTQAPEPRAFLVTVSDVTGRQLAREHLSLADGVAVALPVPRAAGVYTVAVRDEARGTVRTFRSVRTE